MFGTPFASPTCGSRLAFDIGFRVVAPGRDPGGLLF